MSLAPGEREIQRRTFLFAARIIRIVRALPRDLTGQVVARQLVRCGTSIGANVEEAQGSQSKAEFARRMNIALSEARETLYWLRLEGETQIVPTRKLTEITRESEELVRVLHTIVKKVRNRSK